MVVDFRSSPLPPTGPQPSLLVIRGKEVEVVYQYKYLGTILDDRLDWSANAESPPRRGMDQRLNFAKILKSFNVCSKLLELFNTTTVDLSLIHI